MLRLIAYELRHHAAFTVLGAASGVIVMLIIVWSNSLPSVASVSQTVFYTLHPLHVVFSAAATTALYRKYVSGRLLPTVIIGYVGAVGIATLSDSVFPYLGELLLGLPNAEVHIGFIEQWQIVNPAAFLGIAISLWRPHTRLSHSGHVLLSTWASLFHVIMALGATLSPLQALAIFAFLFLAVWLPCCLSDIAFPLAFTGRKPSLEDLHAPL